MSGKRNARPVDRSSVDDGLVRLVRDTREFVCVVVKERCPDVLDRMDDERRGRLVVPDDILATGDPTSLLAVMLEAWDDGFKDVVDAPGVDFRLVDKVRRIRNDFVHNVDETFTEDDLRAIDDLRRGLVRGRAGSRSRGDAQGWLVGVSAVLLVSVTLAGMVVIPLAPAILGWPFWMSGSVALALFGIGFATHARLCRLGGKGALVVKFSCDLLFWGAAGVVMMGVVWYAIGSQLDTLAISGCVVVWMVGIWVMWNTWAPWNVFGNRW